MTAPSLRRHLMVKLMPPAAALALLLGAGGALLITNTVESAHDRLLDGSILAIAERVTVEDGEVTVDLPPVALGMLESQAHDSIYYSISYDGEPVTGYHDLPLTDVAKLAVGDSIHWNTNFRGGRVRIGAEARNIYGKPHPVLIEVAETTNARDVQEWRMFEGLAALELGLLGLIGALAWRAIGRGLSPLAELSRQIDGRSVEGAINLTPLDLEGVPREALAPATALNALLLRLEQSIEAIRHFTADASHQMRSPLAVLRTHAQLVRRHGSQSQVGKGALDDIDGAVARLERLSTQLIALARLDETVEAAREVADLRQIVAEVIAAHMDVALSGAIDIQLICEDAKVPIAVNPVLVEQVVGNLLDNAIRYNRAGGSVAVRIRREIGAVRLEIEDDGPGIPKEAHGRVFDRFYRIPTSGGPSGSGLGLSIVKSVADHLGGSVELTDRQGGIGLVAIVRLPTGD